MSGTNSFTVSTQAGLNAAIKKLDADAPGSYTIKIAADITEGQAGQPAGIYALDVANGVTVTIEGGGFTLNGAGTNGGLAVIGGKVSIQNLTIEDTIATGGAGKNDSGGGAGLGGGLFVGPTASVALTNVSFRTDSAKGGAGGSGGTKGGGAGGNSSLIVPPLGPAGSVGAGGGPGEFGAVGGDGGPGGSGQTGGAGGFGFPGGAGGAGGAGGHGGRGKTGSTTGGNAGPGGRGGDGGAGAGGGRGGIGGAGGGGGKGGAGGMGGTGGLALAFPGVGGNGGSGGAGGSGGHGGAGGFGGGGGAGGAGGNGGNGNNANTSGVGSNFNGDGGPGGRGAAGGAGGFGGGGGGGGKGGAAGLGDTLKGAAVGKSSTGGTGGTGGPGGFGGGGGGGGPGGSNGAKALSGSAHTVVGVTGAGGQGQLGNFGGGGGGGGNSHGAGGPGGGGLGAGGDIFIAEGGTLTIDGGLLSSGTVTGGASGGTGAQGGGAYGSGIFIQGNETITLGAPAGTTLDVNGVIADQTGSGGKGLTGGIGALVINDPGTVKLDAKNTFMGGIVIDSGTLDLAHAGAGGGGVIRFDPGVLEFSPSTTPTNPLENFVAGDSIEIANFAFTHENYTGGVLTLDGAGGPVTLTIPGADPADLQFSVVDGTTVIGTDQTPCFCRGTLIRTDRGEVPVEALEVRDRVVTLSGESRPIAWIGTGRVLVTPGHRCAATPIIVRRSALADNVPHRDLRVTKGHSLFVDGILIPAEFLVNYRSILWDDHAQVVEFYHIELATHDVLLANGAPAETYRDDSNRLLFQNANSGSSEPPKPPCAPVLTGGPIVDALWHRLLERAGPRPGVPLTDEPDLHLLVDGERVDALLRAHGRYVFGLSRRPGELRMTSRSGSPAELGLARDPRVLGVAVRQIRLWQGARLRLLDAADPVLSVGFHAFEPDEHLRWTDGNASLPAAFFDRIDGPCELEFLISGKTRYPLVALVTEYVAA